MLVGKIQVLRPEQGELQVLNCVRIGRTCFEQLLQISGTESNRQFK